MESNEFPHIDVVTVSGPLAYFHIMYEHGIINASEAIRAGCMRTMLDEFDIVRLVTTPKRAAEMRNAVGCARFDSKFSIK